jgi:hypothetical protein
MVEIVFSFESITKFSLRSFLTATENFIQNDYQYFESYYSGKVSNLDECRFTRLNALEQMSEEILDIFQSSANRLNNCGYWELMEIIQDLNEKIQRVRKLPKFLRTVQTKSGFREYTEIPATVGSQRTMENLVTGDDFNDAWSELMLKNNMDEIDWEIDELKPIDGLGRSVIVPTYIIDNPIGKRVLGKDMHRKLQFTNEDLFLVEYEDNLNQKSDILLEMEVGSVPEFPTRGYDNISGDTVLRLMQVPQALMRNFSFNEMFTDVSVIDKSFADGDAKYNVSIKTVFTDEIIKEVLL